MSKPRYELLEDFLFIFEPDLEIEIAAPFFLPRMEKNSKEGDFINKSKLKIKKNLVSHVKEAFLEKDSKFHGERRLYYDNGYLRAKMFYDHGKLHGPSKYFSKDGKLISISWFYQGKKQGVSRQYYLNGNIYCIQRFKEGKRQGLQEYHYDSSKLRTALLYKDGKLDGKAISYWPNGKARRRCFFIEGIKQGMDELFDEQGVLIDPSKCQKNNTK